ncbi:MAG: nucleotidyltransferase [Bacteroidetes bacterium]|nr:nucleotidyltransferase [Bacteroidota bacterium]
MKIIIPMAGMGKRMRPHTLSIPKPLIPIAGKSIVQRLVEEITGVTKEKIEEIAYVIGDFGNDVEQNLLAIANSAGASGKIYYQHEPLGTAHAILCAGESLDGKVIIAYADTLFKADFALDTSKDGIIWVHKVNNPSAFGVVNLDKNNFISGFYEKPEKFVSDLAIIGIYYFRDGEYLKRELQYLIDQDVKTGGEYGITDALQNMKKKGVKFSVDAVEEWLDCGNKEATVLANQRILELNDGEKLVADSVRMKNTSIIEPCYIGANANIINSIIGPYVSVGKDTVIKNSIISNSIIQTNSRIIHQNLDNSMIGNHVELVGNPAEISLGDYSVCITKKATNQ